MWLMALISTDAFSAVSSTNIAVGKTVVTCTSGACGNANDGNTGTRWDAVSGAHHMVIDLGGFFDIARITLRPGMSYPTYQPTITVSTSLDNSLFTQQFSYQYDGVAVKVIDFVPTISNVRYVKVATGAGQPNPSKQYYEIEVYETIPNNFNQSDWRGGETANTATNTSNQTGWMEYTSANSQLNVDASISIQPTAIADNIIQTSDDGVGDTPNVGGFNAGNATGAVSVAGTGINSYLTVTGQFDAGDGHNDVGTSTWKNMDDKGDGTDGTVTFSANFNFTTDDSSASVDDNGAQPDGFAAVMTDASVSYGDKTINVDSAAGFVAGDEILIIQMVHSTNHGRYEFLEINSVNGNTLNLVESPRGIYYSNTSGTDSKTQIVRVPQYTSVAIDPSITVTVDPYDSSTGKGGILIFRTTGTLTVNGTIDTSGKGYPGGAPAPDTSSWGIQGFGSIGAGVSSRSNNAGGGGGGRNPAFEFDNKTWAGNGGGYGTAGTESTSYQCDTGLFGAGSNGGAAGQTYGDAQLTKLYPGSGGGGSNVYYCPDAFTIQTFPGGAGGAGGGIVYITADTITLGGSAGITADGVVGENVAPKPTGGSGSGGSVYIGANTTTIGTGQVAAQGPAGVFFGPSNRGESGAGGDGRIFIEDAGGTVNTTDTLPNATIGGGGNTVYGYPVGVLNSYASLGSTDYSAGATSITINASEAEGFVTGDEVLIIQMSHPTNAGNFEFKKSITVTDNGDGTTTISFGTGLINNYYGSGSNGRAQIVTVPNYVNYTLQESETITPPVYDPVTGTGGIVIFRASGDVNIDGIIDVTAKGYSGAPTVTISDAGTQGETYTGTAGVKATANNAAAGGGGGKQPFDSGVRQAGGGGGGYATAGANGQGWSNTAAGGTLQQNSGFGGNMLYGNEYLTQLFFGSGGGSGSSSGGFNTGGAGGDGGGIVYIAADGLTIGANGSINANGSNGGDGYLIASNDSYLAGGGGGGGGGSIYLGGSTTFSIGTGKVTASGGAGGVGGGGTAGDGRIRLEAGPAVSGTATTPAASVGTAGTTPSGIFTSAFIPAGDSTDFGVMSWLPTTQPTNTTLDIDLQGVTPVYGYDGILEIGSGGSQTTTTDAWTNAQGANAKLGGQSLSFDGDDAVQVSWAPLVGNSPNSSVEAWVYWDGSAGDQMIYTENANNDASFIWRLRVLNGVAIFDIFESLTTTWHLAADDVAIPVNTWTHLVGTLSSTDGMKIYVNGVAEGTNSHNEAWDGGWGPIVSSFIGAGRFGAGTSAYFFSGRIDEVAVYNRTLTGPSSGEDCTTEPNNDICDHYNSGAGIELTGNENGLVELWHFNEGSGPLAKSGARTGLSRQDTLVIGASGTQTTSTQAWTNAQGANAKLGGQAISFDGTNDYILAENTVSFDTPNMTDALTLEAWVYITDYTNLYEIMSKWGGAGDQSYRLFINQTDGILYLRLRDSGDTAVANAVSANPVPLNQWVHVAGTYDGSLGSNNMQTYINGSPDGAPVTYNGGIFSDSVIPVAIGSRSNPMNYFKGRIDEVAIYNTALSAATISNRYNNGGGEELTGSETGLLAVWHLNEGSGTSIKAVTGGMATAWTNIATNGADLGATFDGHSHLRYRVTLDATAALNGVFPTFDSLDIAYTATGYPNGTYTLVSSPFDSEVTNNRVLDWSWTASTPVGTTTDIQLRTSSDGSTWSNWYSDVNPGNGIVQSLGVFSSGVQATLDSANNTGETFTTSANTVTITSIEVGLTDPTGSGSETITLRLWDSVAKTTQLRSASVNTNILSGDSHVFTFGTPAVVSPDTQYFWELTHNGGNDDSALIRATSLSCTGCDGYVNGSPSIREYPFIVRGMQVSNDNIKDSLDDRYFQYQAILSTSDPTVTPSLNNVQVDYEKGATNVTIAATTPNAVENGGTGTYTVTAVGGFGPDQVFYDDVEDGTLAPWSQRGAGTISVLNDATDGWVLRNSGGGNNHDGGQASLSQSVDNWEITVYTKKINTGSNGFGFGVSDASGNGYLGALSGNSIIIYKSVGFAWNWLGLTTNVPAGINFDQWYTMRVSKVGSSLTASVYLGKVDPNVATPLATTTRSDSSYTTGFTQVNFTGRRQSWADNLIVTDGLETGLTVNYTVSGSATSGTDFSALSGTVTIPVGSTTATIDVTALDDLVAEGNESVIVNLSAGNGYIVGNPGSATVTIVDDENAGITVTPTSGLLTAETGTTDTFSVVLTSEPTADVVVGVSTSDNSEGAPSPTPLTFTSGNWSTPQVVTVTGADDSEVDGDIAYTIVTAAAASSDTTYNGIDPADVSVTNADDDGTGITVSPLSGLITTEGGGTATFNVSLNKVPSADVTIGISSDDTSEGTVSTSSLTFTSANWFTPQTVTITGQDDGASDGNVNYNIVTAAATSGDSEFNGINPADVSVTNIDDDTAGITVSPNLDTSTSWPLTTASDYTVSDANKAVVKTGVATLKLQGTNQNILQTTADGSGDTPDAGGFNAATLGNTVISGDSIELDTAAGLKLKDGPDIGSNTVPFLADVDGDGDLDLMIGEGVNVKAYENTGSVSAPIWTANTNWDKDSAVPSGNASPALVDLDGDGDLDLLVGDTGGISYAFENECGEGANPACADQPTWTANAGWNTPGVVSGYAQPYFGDLDDDNDFDLLIGNANGFALGYKNTCGEGVNPPCTGGSGGPTWSQESTWDQSYENYAAPALVDLDNDGDLDLLIGGNSGVSVAYENTCASPCSSGPVWSAKSAWDTHDMGSRSTPAFGDTDNDGDVDLYIGSATGAIHVVQNTGSNTNPIWVWDRKSAWDIPKLGSRTYASPALADLDGDGLLDIMVGSDNNIVYAYKNTGTASSPAWTYTSGWNRTGPGTFGRPGLADLDGDGDTDLAIMDQFANIQVYENTCDATSSCSSGPTWTLNSAWDDGYTDLGSLAMPAFADLDLDGDFDMMVGDQSGAGYAYENVCGEGANPACTGGAGGPTWSRKAAWDESNGLANSTPRFADLDDDGDMDLVLSPRNTGGSLTFENTCGEGANPACSTGPTWSARKAWNFHGNFGVYAVPAFGDVDGDGDPDLLIGEADGIIYAYSNGETSAGVYQTNGSVTSAVIDIGTSNANVDVVSWNPTSQPANTNLTIDIQAGTDNSPDCPGACTNWTGWIAVNNGEDTFTVFDNKQYFRYRATLTSDGSATPQFDDLTINYSNLTGYPTDNPTVVNNTGVSFTQLISFRDVMGANNAGIVKYQISNDGTNWYHHNGTSWVAASGFAQTNTAGEINARIQSFAVDVGTGTFYFKAFLNSDGNQVVELDKVILDYVATNLTTTEAGSAATFDMQLNKAPTDDVIIGLSSNDTSEGTINLSSVTFTPANWNMPQTLTVTGVNDTIDDDDVTYNIVTAAATSSDTDYNGLNAADLSVTNRDDDTAGITITPAAGLTTTEAGGTASFTISLDTTPTDDVTITWSSSDTSEGTVTFNSFIFTSSNTDTFVTVTGVDDVLSDGNQTYTIQIDPATSSDAKYNNMDADDITIINTDDDSSVVGITVNPVSGLTTTEAGGTAKFQVVLNSQPSADVIIGLTSSDTSEGTVTPSSLTFTSSDWNLAQTVTVTGVDDVAVDGDVAFTIITGRASSADTSYNNVNANNVFVTNSDDDFSTTATFGPGIVTIEASDNAATEGTADTGMFRITRAGNTAEDLVVYYSLSGTATAGTDFIAINNSVAIPAGDSSATIIIIPLDDNVYEGDETIEIKITNDLGYIVSAPSSASVIMYDNDTPPPPVNFALDQIVNEGSVVYVDVYLGTSAPEYPVEIPYTVSGTATASVDHNAQSGTFVIMSGIKGGLAFSTYGDSANENDETVVFTLGDPLGSNARLGTNNTHTVTLTERNITPRVTLTAKQAGTPTRTIVSSNGFVTVTANVNDINVTDSHSFNWANSNNNLVQLNTPATNEFVFSPASLTEGFYKVRVAVTDSAGNSTTASLLLQVLAMAPSLTSADSDDDGVADLDEGFGDSDNDGVPDYLDDNKLTSGILQGYALGSDTNMLMSNPELSLQLGDVAFPAATGGAIISRNDMADHGDGEGGPVSNADDAVANTGGYVDFKVEGLSMAGQSIQIVLPQASPIPANAVYRKYSVNTGWENFVIDTYNNVASATAIAGQCLSANDPLYTSGLTEGHDCVQLTIADGGPNDSDGVANHAINVSGGVGSETVPTILINKHGGGSIGPVMLIMLLLLFVPLLVNSVTGINMRGD